MAKKGRKPTKGTETSNPTGSILAALNFLAPAAKFEGPANQTHCMLRNGTAVIFNGLIAIGTLVDIDKSISCNPHLLMLIGALEKCKEETSIVQADYNDRSRLVISSGRYRAFVPCLPDDLFAPVIPSNPIAPMDDRVKTSLEIVGRVAVESAPRLMEASVYIREGSAVATNGKIMFEHWHGNSLPPMTLPKVSVSALCKIAKKLTSFGVEWDSLQQVSSVTFWFEDQSWFRTQLYVEPWPSIDRVLELPANLWPIPLGLFEGLANVADFVDEQNRVYLQLKSISTHDDAQEGASFEIEGTLPEKLILNHELLTMFSGLVTKVDWVCTPDLVKFQGDNFRGCLAKIKPNAET